MTGDCGGLRHHGAVNPKPSDIRLPVGPGRQQLDQAVEQLASGKGVVWLGDGLRLRTTGRTLHCEVIDDAPSAHRCAFEYEVMVENARHAMAASPLSASLPTGTRIWSVVERTGDAFTRIWPDNEVT